MSKIIDGTALAKHIQSEIAHELIGFKKRKPCLVMIQVGNHPASEIYVGRKAKACETIGIQSRNVKLPGTAKAAELTEVIQQLNQDPEVDGILLQMPLPAHLDPLIFTQIIAVDKDVDGFHPCNLGKLLTGQKDGFAPCTPLGIVALLRHSGIRTEGAHAVIIGRSTIVGKPLAALLSQNAPDGNATVTLVHSRSKDLAYLCRQADILVAAAGFPGLVKAEMIKPNAAVIDVGMNRLENPAHAKGYELVGDVDFENVLPICQKITPVPGGVGPMTIAMLMSNTLKSFKRRVHACSES